MPTFRALQKILIPSRSKRLARFVEQFFTPTPSRSHAAADFLRFFVPGIERKGLLGDINEFLNPRVQRTGFIGIVNQFLNPVFKRTGFIGLVNQFLNAPAFRLKQSRDIVRPRELEATALERLISNINEFLNAYTHFADLIGQDIAVITPTQAYLNAMERLIGSRKIQFDRLAQRLLQGDITPDEFRQSMASMIKSLHIQAVLLGVKGLGNVSVSMLGDLALDRINREMAFLDAFLQESFGPNLTQPLDTTKISEKQFLYRLSLYASAGRATGTIAQQALMEEQYGAGIAIGGRMYMRRVTQDDDNVCPDCSDWASLGWVDTLVTVLPPPGTSCRCGSNCRCFLEYCLAHNNGDCPEDIV